MNKRLLSGFLTVTLLLTGPMTLLAETSYGADDWKVFFSQEKKMESNFKSSDMDDVIYGMQPGDQVILKVALENDNENDTNWYMTNKVLSSLEDSVEVASGAAYTYILTYTNGQGEETILFSSDTVGGEEGNPDAQGLHEATGALKEYFYLDSLKKGEKGFVSLTVALDGETQGNDYQDTIADLQMNFAVEVNESLPNEVNEKKGIITILKTGDSNIWTPFYLAGFLCGLLLLFAGFVGLKQRKKDKEVDQ